MSVNATMPTSAPLRRPEAAGAGASAVTPMTRAAIRGRLLDIGRPVLGPLVYSAIARTLALLIGIALLAVAAWGVGAVSAALDGSGPAAPIGGVVLTMVVLSLFKGIFRYLEQFAGHFVAFHALALLRTFFYDKLEPQAPAAIEGRRTGDLLSRVTKDVDRVEVFFAHTLVPAVTAVIVPVLTVAYVALAIDLVVGLVLVPFLVLVGVVVPWLGRAATARAAAQLRLTRGEIAQHVTDSVQGVREVLAFNHGAARIGQLGELDARSAQALAGIGRWIAVRRGLNTVVIALALVAEIVVVAALVDGGDLTWQWGAVALAIVAGAFAPVLAVEDFSADLEQAYASARRIFEVTDAAPLVAEPESPVALARNTPPSVTFNDVTFTYPAGSDVGDVRAEPAVRNVSFAVRPGTTTALVGSSGSGKSTLSSLLVRFWDTNAGSIEIAGTDIRECGLDDLRATVAVAQQRPYLFNDTIKANLLMAKPDATAAELATVCRRAALDEVIEGMPEGMETGVGEMGERLSGGQRQRRAIAREMMRDP